MPAMPTMYATVAMTAAADCCSADCDRHAQAPSSSAPSSSAAPSHCKNAQKCTVMPRHSRGQWRTGTGGCWCGGLARACYGQGGPSRHSAVVASANSPLGQHTKHQSNTRRPAKAPTRQRQRQRLPQVFLLLTHNPRSLVHAPKNRPQIPRRPPFLLLSGFS